MKVGRATMRETLRVVLFTVLAVCVLSVARPAASVRAAYQYPMGWRVQMADTELNKTDTMQVEVGQKFYISDYLYEYYSSVFVYKKATDFESSRKLTYSTSDSKIASVSQKGYVNPKKAGTVKITVKEGKNKYVCTLKVLKKGTLGSSTTYKRMNTLANTIGAAYKKKITSKNFYTLAKAVAEYDILAKKYTKKLEGYWGNLLKTDKLAVPMAGRIYQVKANLHNYAYDKIWKYPSVKGKINKTSAKGGSGTFTVVLKEKLSEKKFYLLAFAYMDVDGYQTDQDETVTLGKNPTVKIRRHISGSGFVTVTDEYGDKVEEEITDTGYVIYTVKPGTNKITANYYSNKKGTKAKKLVKGMTYSNEEEYYGAGSTYSFKVK